jgi:hypothetical protein
MWIKDPIHECQKHGAPVEIFTDSEQVMPDGICANDGDRCRCDEGCSGWMTADGNMCECNWSEEEETE